MDVELSQPFAVFDQQDSGCTSYGVVHEGRRLFAKVATTSEAAVSLRRANCFHEAVHHPAIVAPRQVHDSGNGDVQLIYPWHDGDVLNAATMHGSDRSGLVRFQTQPINVVLNAVATILDAHLAVVAAGFVAVDLYDGCFLWDPATTAMRLIDLDEYRPGPFTVPGRRLPGSLSYLAPEELRRGGTIDERTTVFGLGRTIHHLLNSADGWRGSDHQLSVAATASATDPGHRFPSVAALIDVWNTPKRPSS